MKNKLIPSDIHNLETYSLGNSVVFRKNKNSRSHHGVKASIIVSLLLASSFTGIPLSINENRFRDNYISNTLISLMLGHLIEA